MTVPAEKKLSEARPPLNEVAPLPVPERSRESATKAHAKQVRRARSRRMLKRLALFVLLPTALAGVYFGLIASPQYESYAIFNIQSSEQRPSFGMEGLLAGMAASGGGSDALAVRSFVLSRDMLKALDREQGFIKHYQDPRNDFLARLRPGATFEKAYEYFEGKVYADYDQTSGSIKLRVRAFSPTKAHDIAQSVLKSSEDMVNKMSERQRRDRTHYAEADLKVTEGRLREARAAIAALQLKHREINPLETAGASLHLRTSMEAELAKARADLMQLKSYMNDEAPLVQAANEKIKAISAQIGAESKRLVDPQQARGLSASLSDFDASMLEKEFAEKAYASASAALQVARADADRQHRYLAIIAAPSTPDASTYPHRVRSVLAAFVLTFLLLGIVSLIGATVREHARL
jgi:capsular polysaccharide transport system permease protein